MEPATSPAVIVLALAAAAAVLGAWWLSIREGRRFLRLVARRDVGTPESQMAGKRRNAPGGPSGPTLRAGRFLPPAASRVA